MLLPGWPEVLSPPADDAEAQVMEDGSLMWIQAYDVTGMGDSFGIALIDYAFNEGDYTVSAQPETQP